MKFGALVIVAIAAAPSAAVAQKLPIQKIIGTPCCSITAWNVRTAVATARVTASGQEFDFRVTNPADRSRVKVGLAVYANFANKQVSLDGRTACCAITVAPHASAGPPAGPPARSTTPTSAPSSPTAQTTASAAPAQPTTPEPGVSPPPAQPCCSITAIDTRTGAVTAAVKANGDAFGFSVPDAATRARLRVGQAVYANFARKQVSLDGRTVCCAVTSAPHAPGTTSTATASSGSGDNGAGGIPKPLGGMAGAAAAAVSGRAIELPRVSYGPPSPARLAEPTGPIAPARFGMRKVATVLNGQNATATLIHLRGLDGIEQAPGLPDGVRRLLELHVRTLEKGASDHYIVNTELAAQWAATHPVPDDIRPDDVDKNTHSGCNTWSMHCAGEVAKHAEQQTEEQFDALRQRAVKAWNHASDELTHDWNEVQGCMADHTLSLPPLPVQFNVTPQMTVSMETSGKSKSAGASGTVKGSLGIGFPMQGDFTTNLDLFYIPCLPFVVRPRSLAGSGTLGIGERLTGSVTASGQFDKTFTIPPTGGPKIPIQVFPVIIAGVPVSELDVSAYVEGDIEIGGNGSASGEFEVDNPHQASFGFACSGSSCGAVSHGIPVPTTAKETAELKGNVFVRPDIFTAIQLDFDYDALSVRAGPQPYLLGSLAGCAYGTASQSSAAATTTQENHALTADLDWGVDLRAEALVGPKVEARYRHSVTGDKHIWFGDLAPGGSTGLIAVVAGAGAPTAGAPTAFNVHMPTCYPYTNKIQYRVSWTGNPAPGVNPNCQWHAGGGTCTFDPRQALPISLKWPAAGDYELTVTAVSDEHDRTFEPAPPPTRTAVAVKGG